MKIFYLWLTWNQFYFHIWTCSVQYPSTAWSCNWYDKNCNLEQRFLQNRCGVMGTGIIQGEKTMEVSPHTIPIWEYLVKIIITKWFYILQTMEPILKLGPRGKSIYKEETNVSTYFTWGEGVKVLIRSPHSPPLNISDLLLEPSLITFSPKSGFSIP